MKKILQFIENQWLFWLLASLSLGLAPFVPMPHIWTKLKWVAGGAVGMKTQDWIDFIMHGTPWFILFFSIFLKIRTQQKK